MGPKYSNHPEQSTKPNGNENMPRIINGPGGCSTPEDCMKYCKEHQDECSHEIMRPDNSQRPIQTFNPNESHIPKPPIPDTSHMTPDQINKLKEDFMRQQQQNVGTTMPMMSRPPEHPWQPGATPQAGQMPWNNQQLTPEQQQMKEQFMHQQQNGGSMEPMMQGGMPPSGGTQPPSGQQSYAGNKFVGALIRFLLGY